MQFTQKQERQIAVFLRTAGERFNRLPPKARDLLVLRLKGRIQSEFKHFTRPPHDEEVDAVLTRCAAAANAEAAKLTKEGASEGMALSADGRVWLGVCGGIAERFGWDARLVRLVAFVLGLVTGPLAIMAYLAAYLEMYLTSEDENLPAVDKARLVAFPLGILAATIAFHVGTKLLVSLLHRLYTAVMAQELAPLEKWNWLEENGASLFVWALMFLLPLSVLAALPLANDWDKTLKRVIQAGLALYALALSCGLAAAVVGIILQIVEQLAV